MKPVDNWWSVLVHAWSVRFMLLAAALSGVEVALPFLHGVLPVREGTFAALSGLAVAGAFIARFVAQRKVQ